MKSQDSQVSRRTALKVGAVGVAAGGSIVFLDQLVDTKSPLANSYAACALGKRFVDHYPDPDALWHGETPATLPEWAPRLNALIAEDFKADRTLQVDGWWLAETELRLCVLLYKQSL